jgi:hypothetical protein
VIFPLNTACGLVGDRKMKNSIFALISSCLAGVALAGPLGLEMGTTLGDLKKITKLEKSDTFKYNTKSLPSGHSGFSDYDLLVTPEHGLCEIVAWTPNIRTSAYGDDLIALFRRFESSLQAKYGAGKAYDFLRAGSIWTAPRDWMMGLLKNERSLAMTWPKNAADKLPDNLQTISLKASGLGRETGVVTIWYKFDNFNDCESLTKSQDDSKL